MSNQVNVEVDIPQTVNYQSCTVQAGTTTTLASNQNATVTNSGTVYNAVLDFGIPRGKSAYEQAVAGGYTGTEQEFNEALASDIATVADNISDVNTVGANISDVNAVANNETNINTVADNTSDISSVAANISDVSTVSSISTAVSNVAANETAVLNVSDNLANVNTIASNMNSVLATAADISNVNTVAENIQDVSVVAGISSDVSSVASNSSNINAVSNDLTNINTVAGDKTNVDTVATNISNVNTAVTNMAAIIAAPTAAANAATSATNAQTWAEGTDIAVAALGGTKSSKGWADRAQEIVDTIGQVMHYKGSVATYADLQNIADAELGDVYNVQADDSNYAWTGTTWDMIGSSVDLSAYRTAAAQDVIDAGKQDALTAGEGIAIESQAARTQYDVSNFSQYDFLTIPFAVLTDTSTTEYVYEFTTGSDLSGTQTIAQSEQFLALEMDEGRLTSYNYSAGITYTYPTTLQTNTKYKCKGVYSGTNRTWYLLENGSYTEMFSFNDNSYWPGYANNLFLGSHSQITTRAFKGVIHLASCTIKQNGTTLWDGATARQGIDFVINGSPTIVSHTDTRLVISNTQTSAEWGNITGTLSDQTDLQNALNTKQDALPSQTGQSGKFLTTDGTNPSWANIPAGVSADGTTIEDSSNVFTTVGVKDQKTSNANKMWTGTKAEYDAIVSKDANTFYHITDDEPNTVAYAKADLSNLTHGLENTICTTPATTTSTATSAKPAVVVENYVNGTSWYRVYSDGWCEQGGSIAEEAGNATQTISFLKTFSSAPTVQVTPIAIADTTMGAASYGVLSTSTSNFAIRANNTYWSTLMWQACGYIA